MAVELTSTFDLSYLIPDLRIHLGDTADTPTYSNNTLNYALLMGIKMLLPRWGYKYIVAYNAASENWGVSRSGSVTFPQAAPPVVMYGDERPVVLAASICLKTGLIYTSSIDTVSWRDEEVSYSNITGGKLQEASLMRDIDELQTLVPDRRKRLAVPSKGELPGFVWPPNRYEG